MGSTFAVGSICLSIEKSGGHLEVGPTEVQLPSRYLSSHNIDSKYLGFF